MYSYRSSKSARASGLNTTLWLTRPLSQRVGMPRANSGKNMIGGDGAARIGLHSVIGTDHFLAQPLLDGGVTLLQRTQPGSHHLAAGGVSARGDKGVNVTCLLCG